MTVLQLEYFKHLSQTLHLANTAKHFYVSPPAIASSIRRLEAELYVTLFTTHGRSLVLTDEGKVFLKYVDEILHLLSAAKDELSSEQQSIKNTISIAMTSPVLWSGLFRDFMQKYLDIRVNSTLVKLEQLSSPDVLRSFDFILCSASDFSSTDFDITLLPSDNSPCLIVYKSHPLASKTSIRLIEAKDERFIALSKGYSFREYFDALCQMAGFTPNIVLECDFQLRGAMLAAEYGIMLTTKEVAKADLFGDVSYIDIIDPIFSRTMLLARNKKTKNKQAVNLFQTFTQSYYNLPSE